MRQAVDAATNDLADRKVFVVDEAAWGELKVLLDRPQAKRPELSRLLENASVLETGNR